MEIEITHTDSFVTKDAVIRNGNEQLVIPMGFRMRGSNLVDHDGQLVSELNQHWARRSEQSKRIIFNMYRCLSRCYENNRDYHNNSLHDDRVFVKVAAPYMQRLLNEHNTAILSAQLESLYQDIIPNCLPDHSEDPMLYTYEEYSQLLAVVLSMRSIWPAVEMLKHSMTNVEKDERDMLIWTNIMNEDACVYRNPAMIRLYEYIECFIKKNGAAPGKGDVNVLLAKVMLRRFSKYPIVGAPQGVSLLSVCYNYVAQETHPVR